MLVGASYAATDGVLAALGLDDARRGRPRQRARRRSTTATNLARFVASVGFGALWTFAGLDTAVLVCAFALRRGVVVTAPCCARTRQEPAGA